ncbi:MAG: DNA adenine methylase, partial [Cetobacterium somerae]
APAKKVVYNEKCPFVYGIIKGATSTDLNIALGEFDKLIQMYGLSKENENGFRMFRDNYNKIETKGLMWKELYMLACHSFNNQFRFNSRGEYNMPFGKNRSHFSEHSKKKYIDFVTHVKDLDFTATNEDFRQSMERNYDGNTLYYVDSPYLLGMATYNENGGWTEKDDKDLMDMLDIIHSRGDKFMVSNVFVHKGQKHETLIEWSKKYNVIELDYNYKNCSYHKKDKDSDSLEVIITNY